MECVVLNLQVEHDLIITLIIVRVRVDPDASKANPLSFIHHGHMVPLGESKQADKPAANAV
jgi:hypothetical protein